MMKPCPNSTADRRARNYILASRVSVVVLSLLSYTLLSGLTVAIAQL